jgi:hypothetical protein
MRLNPYISPNQPAMGMQTATLNIKTVNSQAAPSTPIPKSSIISGKATETMLVPKTPTTVPVSMAASILHRWGF